MSVILETRDSKPEVVSLRCSAILIYAPPPTYVNGVKTNTSQYIIHPYQKITDNGETVKVEDYKTYKMTVADLVNIKFPDGSTGLQVFSNLLYFNDHREELLGQVMTPEQIDALDTNIFR